MIVIIPCWLPPAFSKLLLVLQTIQHLQPTAKYKWVQQTDQSKATILTNWPTRGQQQLWCSHKLRHPEFIRQSQWSPVSAKLEAVSTEHLRLALSLESGIRHPRLSWSGIKVSQARLRVPTSGFYKVCNFADSVHQPESGRRGPQCTLANFGDQAGIGNTRLGL